MPRNFKLIFSGLILTAFFCLGMAVICGVAQADELKKIITTKLICVDAAKAKKDLAEIYGEIVVGQGVDYQGNLTVLYFSQHTWTMARITPGGLHCAYASGNDWEMMKPDVKGKKL